MESDLKCPVCGKTLKSKKSLKSHLREHSNRYACPVCNRVFAKKYNLKRHEKIHSKKPKEVAKPIETPKVEVLPLEDIQLPYVQNTFEGDLQVASFKVAGEMDLLHLYSAKRDSLLHYIEKQLKENGAFKYFVHLTVEFEKINNDDELITTTAFFNSFMQMVLGGTTTEEIKTQLDESIFRLFSKIQEFQREGSGWIVSRIKKLQIRKQAKNKFEKDMAKLCINSLYGKMLENKRLRANIELVNDRKRFQKLMAKSTVNSGS